MQLRSKKFENKFQLFKFSMIQSGDIFYIISHVSIISMSLSNCKNSFLIKGVFTLVLLLLSIMSSWLHCIFLVSSFCLLFLLSLSSFASFKTSASSFLAISVFLSSFSPANVIASLCFYCSFCSISSPVMTLAFVMILLDVF